MDHKEIDSEYKRDVDYAALYDNLDSHSENIKIMSLQMRLMRGHQEIHLCPYVKELIMIKW
jgi:hypothetical protein